MSLSISDGAKRVLRELGLTEYETRAYTALLEEGILTASQISERASVPYSKVYETLNSLEGKGWIETDGGRPSRYYPKSPSQAMVTVKLRLEDRLKSWEQTVLGELQPLYEKREIREKPDIWILRGEFNILAKLQEMLGKAKGELLIAAPTLTRALVEAVVPLLARLEGSRVKVLFLATKDAEKMEIGRITTGEVRVRDQMFGGGIIVDGREAVLFLGEDTPNVVIWSNHSGLVKFAKDYFQYLWGSSEGYVG